MRYLLMGIRDQNPRVHALQYAVEIRPRPIRYVPIVTHRLAMAFECEVEAGHTLSQLCILLTQSLHRFVKSAERIVQWLHLMG